MLVWCRVGSCLGKFPASQERGECGPRNECHMSVLTLGWHRERGGCAAFRCFRTAFGVFFGVLLCAFFITSIALLLAFSLVPSLFFYLPLCSSLLRFPLSPSLFSTPSYCISLPLFLLLCNSITMTVTMLSLFHFQQSLHGCLTTFDSHLSSDLSRLLLLFSSTLCHLSLLLSKQSLLSKLCPLLLFLLPESFRLLLLDHLKLPLFCLSLSSELSLFALSSSPGGCNGSSLDGLFQLANQAHTLLPGSHQLFHASHPHVLSLCLKSQSSLLSDLTLLSFLSTTLLLSGTETDLLGMLTLPLSRLSSNLGLPAGHRGNFLCMGRSSPLGF